jgi:hypothetical protein
MDSPIDPKLAIDFAGLSRAERDRVEYQIDQIVRLIRQHPHQDQSKMDVRSGVFAACLTMIVAGHNQRAQKSSDPRWRATPFEVNKTLNSVPELSSALISALDRLPAHMDMLLFDDDRSSLLQTDPAAEEWSVKNRLVKELRKLSTINCAAPHHKYDFVKKLSGEIACLLMIKHSTATPASTAGGLLRTIAGHLYEVACHHATASSSTSNVLVMRP